MNNNRSTMEHLCWGIEITLVIYKKTVPFANPLTTLICDWNCNSYWNEERTKINAKETKKSSQDTAKSYYSICNITYPPTYHTHTVRPYLPVIHSGRNICNDVSYSHDNKYYNWSTWIQFILWHWNEILMGGGELTPTLWKWSLTLNNWAWTLV